MHARSLQALRDLEDRPRTTLASGGGTPFTLPTAEWGAHPARSLHQPCRDTTTSRQGLVELASLACPDDNSVADCGKAHGKSRRTAAHGAHDRHHTTAQRCRLHCDATAN